MQKINSNPQITSYATKMGHKTEGKIQSKIKKKKHVEENRKKSLKFENFQDLSKDFLGLKSINHTKLNRFYFIKIKNMYSLKDNIRKKKREKILIFMQDIYV